MFGLISQKRFSELQKKCAELQCRLELHRDTEAKSRIVQEENTKLITEFNEVKKQVREQTEADLFFISAKIQKKLLDGEPKESVQNLYAQQGNFQEQLAHYYSHSHSGGMGELFAGTLGSLLGNKY